jgi:hypothetical protein
MVPWTKMMPIDSSIRFHGAQSNLNDILITHVKFYRQWLLIHIHFGFSNWTSASNWTT